MTSVVEVRFKGNRKEYFTWPSAEPLALHDAVIVEVERGEDCGRVSALGELAEKKCTRCGNCALGGDGRPDVTRRVLRRASMDDVRRADELRREEDEVRKKVRERTEHHSLEMKPSDAEWQWDRRKLTVYFTAEHRVDFRALVRDLAAMFRTRIELRQIGARDEARRLDGVGRCGRQYCSAGWLPELLPVGLSLAKDQHLSLNPSQISGPCGRLLCCLRFEHEFYVESRKRFPKEGKVLRTRVGPEKVLAVDIFRDRVTLRAEGGSTRVAELADLTAEVEQSGATLVSPEAAPAAPPPTADAGDAPDGDASTGSGRPRRRRGRGGPGAGA